MLRQQAGLSSFSIPDKNLNDEIGKNFERGQNDSMFSRELFRNERQALEKHTKESGCMVLRSNEGYLQTIFCKHDRTVRKWIDLDKKTVAFKIFLSREITCLEIPIPIIC